MKASAVFEKFCWFLKLLQIYNTTTDFAEKLNIIFEAEAVSQGMTEPPEEITMLPEPSENTGVENADTDDIENLKLKISE